LDNETSWLILLSTGGEIALGLWKINKASKVVSTESFPYFKLDDKDTYQDSET
jgi:hypothetical protein